MVSDGSREAEPGGLYCTAWSRAATHAGDAAVHSSTFGTGGLRPWGGDGVASTVSEGQATVCVDAAGEARCERLGMSVLVLAHAMGRGPMLGELH